MASLPWLLRANWPARPRRHLLRSGPRRRSARPARPRRHVVAVWPLRWLTYHWWKKVKCHWPVVHYAVSMFTRSGLCAHLKALIDQTPRGATDLRQALRARLGDHFQFQGAPRVAHGRIEEESAQSHGLKQFMLVSSMSQHCNSVPQHVAPPIYAWLRKHMERVVMWALLGLLCCCTSANVASGAHCGHGLQPWIGYAMQLYLAVSCKCNGHGGTPPIHLHHRCRQYMQRDE